MENIIDENEVVNYIPKAALIVFEGTGHDSYIELREIRRDGSMAGAKPVSKEFIQSLLATFSQEYRSIPHGAVPENLLYCDTRRGRETYVWYNPPMKRYRYFDKRLGLEEGQYHVPGTLYAVRNGQLQVFCFEGRKPKADETLLGVPYFHVGDKGHVCMGSAKVRIPNTDRLSYQDILYAWENAFWNSRDVHTGGSPSTRENLIETIRKYQTKPFDTEELVTRKDGLTLNRLIANIKK